MAKLFAAKGTRSWGNPTAPTDAQRGGPSPGNAAQARPAGSMPNAFFRDFFGGPPLEIETPYFSRGAAAYVPQFGVVPTNPIGAGIFAPFRPRPYYAAPGTYEADQLFWLSQAIPTTVRLQGLSNADALAAVLGPTYVKAAVRTTG